jgi:hypothetical protein
MAAGRATAGGAAVSPVVVRSAVAAARPMGAGLERGREPGSTPASVEDSITRRGARASSPDSRTSSRGESASNVPRPTRIASCRLRSRCACARDCGPVIQRLVPSAIAMHPSSEVASFNVTCGRPRACRDKNPAIDRRASAARKPVDTAMPAASSRANPALAVRASESSSAATTRATPAETSKSEHAGPRGETCAHGSRVTYAVPPLAASPASASAIASACGRPPGCVQPRPTTRPFFTITHPTLGLGAVRPRVRSASASATPIHPESRWLRAPSPSSCRPAA